ncbi:MAG: molybdenum cofactor biosynthesis protein MoaB [Proteobacteria bacterium]|nr:molybdenum cofactor biosynthesis protein MoaB [Pseudomonadota bacterium]
MTDPSPGSRHHHHRREALEAVPTAVVTVSDTRTLETDTGGQLVEELLRAAGHPIAGRQVVADEADAIQAALRKHVENPEVRAVVLTGGTGVAPRDVTPESVAPLLERTIPGFGELFRQLSYAEIGSAALLSRALAGLARGTVVFVLPGSRGAVRLGLEKLVLPELGHLAAEAVKTRSGSAT